VTANWKLNMTAAQSAEYVRNFLPLVADVANTEIVLAPPFTALDRTAAALAGSRVRLAAQNANPNASGAFTGEISPEMLAEFDCHYAIVGHSERRAIYGESSGLVARKALTLLAAGIRPIVCVGETLEERENGHTFDVLSRQLEESLSGLAAERAPEVVVAYEPVWAIGTGMTATPDQAQAVHAFIRNKMALQDDTMAGQLRILYGGSVNGSNAADLFAREDIDGGLVGGASLTAEDFLSICHYAV